jgi:hypothetical protein
VRQDIDMGAIFFFRKEQMLKESQNISSASQLTKQ